MVSAGQIDTLDQPQRREQVQGTEYRRPADPRMGALRIGDQLGCREVPRPGGDEAGDDPPRCGYADPGALERADQRMRRPWRARRDHRVGSGAP